MMKKLILLLLIALASASFASADTIYLRGGTTLRGTVLGFINGRFAIQLTSGAILPVNPANNSNQPPVLHDTPATTPTVRAAELLSVGPRALDGLELER